jgi:transposase
MEATHEQRLDKEAPTFARLCSNTEHNYSDREAIPRHSSMGRPRALTDAQVAEILEWNKATKKWKAMGAGLETYRQIAARLGVSPITVYDAVKCKGLYKQAGRSEGSPEQNTPTPPPARS